jgi:hypothetical protein
MELQKQIFKVVEQRAKKLFYVQIIRVHQQMLFTKDQGGLLFKTYLVLELDEPYLDSLALLFLYCGALRGVVCLAQPFALRDALLVILRLALLLVNSLTNVLLNKKAGVKLLTNCFRKRVSRE